MDSQYNELGFYTVTSQPGKSSNSKSGWTQPGKTSYDTRKQRAYIRGYMDRNMVGEATLMTLSSWANYLVENIKSKNFFLRSEDHNAVLDVELCQCGSVIFIDDKPATNYFDIGDYIQSFNLGLPLRRPYDEIKNERSSPI